MKYIKSFQAINNRKGTEKNFYKYEKVCLLIVDFSQTPAKIYNTSDELKESDLFPKIQQLILVNFLGKNLYQICWKFIKKDLLPQILIIDIFQLRNCQFHFYHLESEATQFHFPKIREW